MSTNRLIDLACGFSGTKTLAAGPLGLGGVDWAYSCTSSCGGWRYPKVLALFLEFLGCFAQPSSTSIRLDFNKVISVIYFPCQQF